MSDENNVYLITGLGALLFFSILSFAFILIKITYNSKLFKGDLFNMYAIMVSIHLIQNCSFYLYLSSYRKFQLLLFVLTDTCLLVWNSILVYNTYHFICFHSKILKKNWVWSIITGFVIPSIITIISFFFKISNENEIKKESNFFWISISEKNIYALVFGWIDISNNFLFFQLIFLFRSKESF